MGTFCIDFYHGNFLYGLLLWKFFVWTFTMGTFVWTTFAMGIFVWTFTMGNFCMDFLTMGTFVHWPLLWQLFVLYCTCTCMGSLSTTIREGAGTVSDVLFLLRGES